MIICLTFLGGIPYYGEVYNIRCEGNVCERAYVMAKLVVDNHLIAGQIDDLFYRNDLDYRPRYKILYTCSFIILTSLNIRKL